MIHRLRLGGRHFNFPLQSRRAAPRIALLSRSDRRLRPPGFFCQFALLRVLRRRTRRLLATAGVRTTDWLFGLHQSGHLSAEYVEGIVARLRPGTTEIYLHPAMDIGATPPPAE